MTASAAEAVREEGKKSRERGEEGEGGEERTGRPVSIREGEKGGAVGEGGGRRKSTYANTRHIQPLVPTFVRSVLCDDCR